MTRPPEANGLDALLAGDGLADCVDGGRHAFARGGFPGGLDQVGRTWVDGLATQVGRGGQALRIRVGDVKTRAAPFSRSIWSVNRPMGPAPMIKAASP